MDDLEQQLLIALRRHNPREGFTDQVMEAVAAVPSRKTFFQRWRARGRFQSWKLIPALGAFLVASGGALYQQHEQTERGQAAKQQLLTAIRIAGTRLHSTQERVISIGEDVGADARN